MQKQTLPSLADSMCDLRSRKIKKTFFTQINSLLDWDSINNIISTHYQKGKSGRRLFRTMLRTMTHTSVCYVCIISNLQYMYGKTINARHALAIARCLKKWYTTNGKQTLLKGDEKASRHEVSVGYASLIKVLLKRAS